MVVAQIGALGGGISHYRPVICLSDCRSGEDQNNALKRYCACVYFETLLFSSSGCSNLPERAFFVPRLALIGGLRQSYGRERDESGDHANS